MSQSLLYHAFGIKGVTYRSTDFIGNAIIFRSEFTDKHTECPSCGSHESIFKGQKIRFFRMPPLGRKQTLLNVKLHRLQCKKCCHLWWPRLPFVDGTVRYTRFFALTVLDLLKLGTIKAVAEYLHVAWDVVKDIHKNKLTKVYRKVSLKEIKYLGIDEFSLRKRHVYMTIFVDLRSGRIVHAVEGTRKEDIAPFLRKVAAKAKKLKAVAMDMSVSYSSAVAEILPKIPVVFDRYHVMALMNRKIDGLRRDQQRTLEGDGKQVLKGSRFLLLRNYEVLGQDDRGRLDELLEANQPLYIMHTMKEQLRLFWEQGNVQNAGGFLAQWCFDALLSGVQQLNSVGHTMIKHWKGLISYYPHKITNALLEGINNKIKTMKRQAYGYRDMEYFKLRLYDLHNSGYAFTG